MAAPVGVATVAAIDAYVAAVASTATLFTIELVALAEIGGSSSSSSTLAALLSDPGTTNGLHFGSHAAWPVVQISCKDRKQRPLVQWNRYDSGWWCDAGRSALSFR